MKASFFEEAFSFILKVDLTITMTIDISFKRKVHEACAQYLDEKISTLKSEMNDLVSSAANDSKSTAGDKHETARAMMQQEQQRLGEQLREAEIQRTILARLNDITKFPRIIEGSLIFTDRNTFYISIPLGKIEVDKNDIFVISAQSPLAIKMLGKQQGEKIEQNTTIYTIEEVI